MTAPTPDITDLSRPFWAGLAQGRLQYQHCRGCGASWLPARECCPECLADAADWRPASGRGRILSWVVYHHAYAPHLSDRVPYNVAIVELAEGPRLLTNIIDAPRGEGLSIGAQVCLAIEQEGSLHLPRFALLPESETPSPER